MAELVSPENITAALVGLGLVLKGLHDHQKGSKRDRFNTEKLDTHFSNLAASIDTRFSEVRRDVAELRAELTEVRADIGEVRAEVTEVRSFCVGPDGKNGFRRDISEIQADIKELQRNDRERLERKAYDRRAGT